MTDEYSKLCDLIMTDDVDGLKKFIADKTLDLGKSDFPYILTHPLMLATFSDEQTGAKMLKILIDGGINLHSENAQKAFLSAIESTHTQKVKVFLEAGIDVNKEIDGCLPLIEALKRENMNMALFLKQQGADEYLKDAEGSSAYSYLKNMYQEKLKAYFLKLLKEKTKNNQAINVIDIDKAVGKNKETLLTKAIDRRDLKEVELLIFLGADVFQKNSNGVDAYNYCMQKGQPKCAEVIKNKIKQQLNKAKGFSLSYHDIFPLIIDDKIGCFKIEKEFDVFKISASKRTHAKIHKGNFQMPHFFAYQKVRN